MSHLSNAINRLMLEQPELTARSLAKKTGIDPSALSMLRSGRRDYISQENLASLAIALGRTGKEKAELIASHLRDEACGFYPEIIQITVRNRPIDHTSQLDPDLDYIQQNLSDPALRQAVKGLAEVHRRSQNRSQNSESSGNNGTKHKSTRSQ